MKMKTTSDMKKDIIETISIINNYEYLHYILTFITTPTNDKWDKDHE